MKIHFIAIGGSAMHNLAIALKLKGYTITGSDDLINDPSKSRLKKYNLLPVEEGWFSEKISIDIDAIVLGMHAKEDNPELLEARRLNIEIVSYPELVIAQCKAGIVGSFPALNARPAEELEKWYQRISAVELKC